MTAQIENHTGNGRAQVIVATSVMLSFISFWRAAAIVLNDLGSSAYYVGGIAEKAVGRAAPWFIFGVMLFSYAVRAIYIESCAMFTRGGVYRVVKEAMGGTLAKLSVSALMFDYMLTGPISGVSAGQYIIGLISQTTVYLGHPWTPSVTIINYLAAGIAGAFTILIKPAMQRLPPSPAPHNLVFNSDAVGWMPRLLPRALQEVKSDSAQAN